MEQFGIPEVSRSPHDKQQFLWHCKFAFFLWELMMVIIMVTILVINGSSGYDGCNDDGNIIVW